MEVIVKTFERIAQEQEEYWKKAGVPDMHSRMAAWCAAVEEIGEDAMEEYCNQIQGTRNENTSEL